MFISIKFCIAIVFHDDKYYYHAEEERVDILINNAATNQSLRKISKEEGIELMLMTNHLGPFLLTNLLLDKIKVSTLVLKKPNSLCSLV